MLLIPFLKIKKEIFGLQLMEMVLQNSMVNILQYLPKKKG